MKGLQERVRIICEDLDLDQLVVHGKDLMLHQWKVAQLGICQKEVICFIPLLRIPESKSPPNNCIRLGFHNGLPLVVFLSSHHVSIQYFFSSLENVGYFFLSSQNSCLGPDGWFGHVQSTLAMALVKSSLALLIDGPLRGMDRPKMTWIDLIKLDLEKSNIFKDLVEDRSRN